MKIVRLILTLSLFMVPCIFVQAKLQQNLKVSFLDIGQGDAIYIEAPNGNQMIIDGGPKNALINALEGVMPYGDRSINVIMVTNPDADHYSGFIGLMKDYNVGTVIESGTKTDTPTYHTFRDIVAEKNIPNLVARKGMTITLDKEHGVVFTVLFPDMDVSGWSRNDGSIMGVLAYGKTKVFFTGDGTKTTENAVMLRTDKEMLESDIIKIGHHGSRTSSSDAFIKAIAPMYAVISSGKGNSYGHPHKETLDTLNKNHVQILRTDSLGAVTFISDGNSFKRK